MREVPVEEVTVNAESIVYVLQKMEVGRVKRSGEWLHSSCPLAPWMHAGGVDRHPSFGVKEARGISGVNCFSCGFKGGMLQLVRRFGPLAIESGLWTQEDLQEVTDYVLLAESEDEVLAPKEVLAEVLVGEELRRCLNVSHPYFEERGVTEAMVHQWNLGYVEDYTDTRGDLPSRLYKRVLFPVYERDGKRLDLKGIVGRTTLSAAEAEREDEPKYKNAPPKFKKSHYLLGLWHQEKQRRLVVVEGPMDAITLNAKLVAAEMDVEFLAVSLLGASPSHRQLSLLKDHADEVVCMLDNDPSGKLGTKAIIEALEPHLLVSVVEYPEGVKDPDLLGEDALAVIEQRVSVLQHRMKRLLGG